MGTRLEGTNYQRQVVPERVLLERSERDQRFVAPVIMHKLYEIVSSKITKQDVTSINRLVFEGKYKSRSELIRAAVQKLLQEHSA